jgi:hypothetical protein
LEDLQLSILLGFGYSLGFGKISNFDNVDIHLDGDIDLNEIFSSSGVEHVLTNDLLTLLAFTELHRVAGNDDYMSLTEKSL